MLLRCGLQKVTQAGAENSQISNRCHAACGTKCSKIAVSQHKGDKWQANSRAQRSVSKSPSLNEIPVEKLNDKIPIPSRHKKEEIKILRLGRFLLMIHHKNGTITTLDAVMNALLDGVVYCNPTV